MCSFPHFRLKKFNHNPSWIGRVNELKTVLFTGQFAICPLKDLKITRFKVPKPQAFQIQCISNDGNYVAICDTMAKNVLYVIDVVKQCTYVSTSSTPRPSMYRQMAAIWKIDIFKCLSFYENCCIFISVSLKFISDGSNNGLWALVEIMTWRRTGGKPLSVPTMV